MKTYLHDILLVLMGLIFGAIFYGSIQAWNYKDPDPIVITEYRTIEAEPEIVKEIVYVPYEEPFYRNLTAEDCFYLKDRAMAEAEGEGVIGQCWVMYCIICRAKHFGISIKEVCESSAFESSKSRWGLTPNNDCNEALALIEEGWKPEPLWFARGQYHKNLGKPLCQVGNHCFSM